MGLDRSQRVDTIGAVPLCTSRIGNAPDPGGRIGRQLETKPSVATGGRRLFSQLDDIPNGLNRPGPSCRGVLAGDPGW